MKLGLSVFFVVLILTVISCSPGQEIAGSEPSEGSDEIAVIGFVSTELLSPLPQAVVRLWCDGNTEARVLRVSPNGEFHQRCPVEGALRVEVSAPGYETVELACPGVESLQARIARVVLRPEKASEDSRILVYLVDRALRLARGVPVRIRWSTGSAFESRTLADGTVRTDEEPPEGSLISVDVESDGKWTELMRGVSPKARARVVNSVGGQGTGTVRIVPKTKEGATRRGGSGDDTANVIFHDGCGAVRLIEEVTGPEELLSLRLQEGSHIVWWSGQGLSGLIGFTVGTAENPPMDLPLSPSGSVRVSIGSGASPEAGWLLCRIHDSLAATDPIAYGTEMPGTTRRGVVIVGRVTTSGTEVEFTDVPDGDYLLLTPITMKTGVTGEVISMRNGEAVHRTGVSCKPARLTLRGAVSGERKGKDRIVLSASNGEARELEVADDGSFEFTGLRAGLYWLKVVRTLSRTPTKSFTAISGAKPIVLTEQTSDRVLIEAPHTHD